MRTVCKTFAVLALVVAVVVTAARAEEDKKPAKKVTLKGELGCAKCVFKVKGITACTNAIKVKEGGKDVVYIIDDGGKKAKYHGSICTDSKKGSVTGVVSKKGDQKVIKPAKDGVKLED